MPCSPTRFVNGITKINPMNLEKKVAADKINVPRSNRDNYFQLLLIILNKIDLTPYVSVRLKPSLVILFDLNRQKHY